MTASRLERKAKGCLAAGMSLLAVIVFSRCGGYREFVRRGELLDSIAVRLERIERRQAQQEEKINRLRADALTAFSEVEKRLGEVDAELFDLQEQLDRIGRRVGAWRGELTSADAGVQPETTVFRPDTTVAGVDADRLYNTAYIDFTRGNYQVAITGFRRFIKLFPSSEMADNAQYWVGECFYSLNQLDSALVEFKRVVEVYPKGNKVPAAIYKIGLIYRMEGKEHLAQQQFKMVVTNYPETPEAKLAQERLKPGR